MTQRPQHLLRNSLFTAAILAAAELFVPTAAKAQDATAQKACPPTCTDPIDEKIESAEGSKFIGSPGSNFVTDIYEIGRYIDLWNQGVDVTSLYKNCQDRSIDAHRFLNDPRTGVTIKAAVKVNPFRKSLAKDYAGAPIDCPAPKPVEKTPAPKPPAASSGALMAMFKSFVGLNN